MRPMRLVLAVIVLLAACGNDDSDNLPTLAYIETEGGVSRLASVRADGSDHKLLATEAISPLAGPKPTSDGSILFSGPATGGSAWPWRILRLADGTTNEYVTPDSVRSPLWSPTNGKVAWLLPLLTPQLGVVTRGTTVISARTPDDFVVGPVFSWSPDGTNLAVERVVRNGDDGDLYIFSTSGDITPLLVGDTFDYLPNWSAVTNRIAFQRFTFDAATRGIFTIAPDGTDLRPVVLGNYGGEVQWSPDGTTILTIQFDAAFNVVGLVRVNAASGQVTPLTSFDPLPLNEYRWSPNGAYILARGKVNDQRDGKEAIFTIDMAGNRQQATPDNVDATLPAWIP